MDIDIKAWLYDILNAINEIESFFGDTPKEFELYIISPFKYKTALPDINTLFSFNSHHNSPIRDEI